MDDRQSVNRRVHPTSRFGRIAGVVAALVVILAVAVLAFWAGRTAMMPPEDPLAADDHRATYEVVEQTLQRSLRFAAEAEWQARPLPRAWASGVVTSVDFESGGSVAPGDVVFSVDLRPVTVAEGLIPAFRELETGATGGDVAQLQVLLTELGHFDGQPDGEFGPSTADAVRAWQESLGVDVDGVVRQGDVLFVPDLPLRLVATETLAVGAPLSGGEVVLEGLSADPEVVIPLSIEQRELVPISGAVTIAHAGGTWDAVIARAVERTEQGTQRLDLVLESTEGGPVCGSACADAIPAVGTTNFPAEIVVVPETTGPVIPIAAIITNPGGDQMVVLADGREVSIEVLVSTNALAVVRGIDVGDVVVLPFIDPGGG